MPSTLANNSKQISPNESEYIFKKNSNEIEPAKTIKKKKVSIYYIMID